MARGFSGDSDHLAGIIAKAVAHQGFSLVDILQPCVSFNKVNTFSWYKERVFDANEGGHDPTDFVAALDLCQNHGEKIPLGVFYEKQGPWFPEGAAALAMGPLREQPRNTEKVKEIIAGLSSGNSMG